MGRNPGWGSQKTKDTAELATGGATARKRKIGTLRVWLTPLDIQAFSSCGLTCQPPRHPCLPNMDHPP